MKDVDPLSSIIDPRPIYESKMAILNPLSSIFG